MIGLRAPKFALRVCILGASLSVGLCVSLQCSFAQQNSSSPDVAATAKLDRKKCHCAGALCGCDLKASDGTSFSLKIPKTQLNTLTSKQFQILSK